MGAVRLDDSSAGPPIDGPMAGLPCLDAVDIPYLINLVSIPFERQGSNSRTKKARDDTSIGSSSDSGALLVQQVMGEALQPSSIARHAERRDPGP